jgi:hypothetical protein
MITFPLINFTIMTLISAVHFYWVFGGKFGVDAAIPTNLEGKNMLSSGKFPSIFATLVVAFGLLFMALLHLEKVQIEDPLINLHFPNSSHWRFSICRFFQENKRYKICRF